MNAEESDGRLSYDEAVHYVQQHPEQAAFAAMPVFGERTEDEDQHAEGAKVFVLVGDGAGSYRLRYVAGPFFASVHGAEETLAPAEIPEQLRELRFLPTRFEEAWIDEQMQLLIQKLIAASGQATPSMPDYAAEPVKGAGPDAVFPVSFIGRREAH